MIVGYPRNLVVKVFLYGSKGTIVTEQNRSRDAIGTISGSEYTSFERERRRTYSRQLVERLRITIDAKQHA